MSLLQLLISVGIDERDSTFETSDGSTKSKHEFNLAHLICLINNTLQQSMIRFNLRSHLSQLGTDDLFISQRTARGTYRMINQLLAKSLPLKRVLESLFVTYSGESIRLDYNSQSLMIEIGHNNLKSRILLPNQILHWNFDILKIDIRSPTGPDSLAIHPSNTHSWHRLLNQQKTHALHPRPTCTDCNSEIIRPNSVGDPF